MKVIDRGQGLGLKKTTKTTKINTKLPTEGKG